MNFLDVKQWKVDFKPGWNRHFKKFDKSTQKHIIKKINQMEQPLSARGMVSSRYQIEEVGQYRIGFIQDLETKTKHICFIGNHKQYERWYKSKCLF